MNKHIHPDFKFQYFHTRFNLHFESNYHPDTCFSLINPTNRHDEKRNRERKREWELGDLSPKFNPNDFSRKKKKKIELERSLSNPFQPYILVTFDRSSFQDFHFDFVPFLFRFVIRLEIDRIFSVHSLFSSFPLLSGRFIIRPSGISFSLPKSYWDDRVTSSHFVILEPRFQLYPPMVKQYSRLE